MKITVFGATGHVGRLFVERALAAGHSVTAYVRKPQRIDAANQALRVVVGTLEDEEKINEAIAGSDAVVSVVGPLGRQYKLIFAPAYEKIVRAMKTHGVKRLIALGTPSMPDSNDKFNLIFFGLILVVGSLIHKGYEDIRKVGEIVRESGLEWTVVRVPLLTNRPARGNPKVGYFGNGVTWPRLSRADFADFLMKELTDRTYIGKAPAISN